MAFLDNKFYKCRNGLVTCFRVLGINDRRYLNIQHINFNIENFLLTFLSGIGAHRGAIPISIFIDYLKSRNKILLTEITIEVNFLCY